MKNNYDLILNFEERDGKPLSEKTIECILMYGEMLGKILDCSDNNVKVWKVVISQAVDSKKIVV